MSEDRNPVTNCMIRSATHTLGRLFIDFTYWLAKDVYVGVCRISSEIFFSFVHKFVKCNLFSILFRAYFYVGLFID